MSVIPEVRVTAGVWRSYLVATIRERLSPKIDTPTEMLVPEPDVSGDGTIYDFAAHPDSATSSYFLVSA